VNEDFHDLLGALIAAHARFLVVGAHAMAAHGVPRATGDLDVWISSDHGNAGRVWEALSRSGAFTRSVARKSRRPMRSTCTISALLLLAACTPALRLARDDSDTVLARQLLDASDPRQPGPFQVQRLYYGSGTDRNRPEYRDSVMIRTEPVDASKLVDLGGSAKSRNDYWGFAPKEMPLNGRVWYPEGAGPFPLVLIAHGNHNMKDFSDPGYAYMGEHLASRGYIVASLDMNFINGGIRQENDARGWFFLKHLEAWRGFNEAADNPFRGRVDMDNIALIGHSRGGEAVGHAAAFNRLERYPDDANVSFDFGFAIKSIIAIAPVDGQYRPTDRLVPLVDVNYLVFHGSHDGDVSAFMGLRQYQRVTFTDSVPRFKSLVFVYRANHGQWNTVWGPNDNGTRSSRILDLRALMDPEDQRTVAKVYFTAFLDATLKGDRQYLPLFRDHRVAGGWLPKTMYITRFEESSFRPVATFEEDIDVTTGADGVRLSGDSLTTWREERLELRTTNSADEGTSQYNNAVVLGWNNRIAGADTTRHGRPASYSLRLPDGYGTTRGLDRNASLQFLLMPTDATPSPRRTPRDSTAQSDSVRDAPRPSRRGDDEKPPIDLSIEVVDAAGVRASVPLSRYGAIRRPLESWILRRRDIEEDRFAETHEIVLQTFVLPLADFVAAAPSLDLTRLREVRFLFDRVVAGTVIVDDIGFARMDAAFRAATDGSISGGSR
jgi:dienelactone hydrolase